VLEFGIFDHLDSNGLALGEFFEQRLQLIELIERGGFYGYHLAEHHSTPLGLAGSPSVFLASAFARTTTLRLGPLVYVLPLHHPLRLYEEICMLDQMSGGRLELGIGRGVSPFETRAYGLDFAQTGEIYHEAFQLILNGLTSDELTFEGKHYQFHKVPMILRPLQRPHPPLWYGITIPENADWPAANDVNIVTIALRPMVRLILDRYRAERTRLGKRHHPFMGVARHVVVADSDEAALAIARRAYPRWRGNFRWLFARHGAEPRIATLYPPTFDELAAIDNAVAGSSRTVRDFIAAEIEATGSNYFVAWLAFGDMSLEESLRSLELFAREVMPAFARVPADAAQ